MLLSLEESVKLRKHLDEMVLKFGVKNTCDILRVTPPTLRKYRDHDSNWPCYFADAVNSHFDVNESEKQASKFETQINKIKKEIDHIFSLIRRRR